MKKNYMDSMKALKPTFTLTHFEPHSRKYQIGKY